MRHWKSLSREMRRAAARLGPLLVASTLLTACGPGRAADPFPFVIPWDDASHTLTDVSFLNDGPAGSHGFILSRGGHFVESQTGRRIRFLGVDFTFGANFPSHADAEKVAARLAKYGVNLIRFHHMDNEYGASGSILEQNAGDHRHLDPGQLDRLDYLISQLKKHGIYANLNLHVSRTFGPEDGFPAGVKDISFGYDKRVDYFDPRMIELQKEYARQLLAHVNPYTGNAYTNEPAVLNVEITNEDSLVGDPWEGKGDGLADLPQPFESELQSLWNEWLARKYRTTDAVQAGWLKGTTPPGADMLKPTPNPADWTAEKQPTTDLSLSAEGAALKLDVLKVDGTDWHVQLHQTGLDLQNGDTYTVTFRAKADVSRSIGVYTALDQADWHNTGLSQDVTPGPEWKSFHFVFQVHGAVPNHGRLTFSVGQKAGTIWLADVTLKPGAAGAGVQPGESLEAKSIPVPTNSTPAERLDWLSFLADTERSFADGMRRYLKNDLHLHSLVICSQISWGGLAGLYREANMDFADNHAYWEHPSFPNKPWDPVDWTIGDTSMIPQLGKGDELTRLAAERVFGKPYTISEYNEPAPNEFQAECVPLYAAVAAAQDWDAIYLFDYGSYGEGSDNGQIQGFFGVGSNPAKWAYVPAAAMIFRGGEVSPASGIDVHVLPSAPASLLAPQTVTEFDDWEQQARQKVGGALVGIAPSPSQAPPAIPEGGAELNWQTTIPDAASFTANGDGAIVAAGFLSGQTLTLTRQHDAVAAQTTSVKVGETPNRFGVVTVTAMDRQALSRSARILITAVDRVENTGMEWTAAHNSVGSHWGTAPTRADGVPMTVSLTTDGPRKVYALDPTGAPGRAVPSTYANGKVSFTVGPADGTLWYGVLKE